MQFFYEHVSHDGGHASALLSIFEKSPQNFDESNIFLGAHNALTLEKVFWDGLYLPLKDAS